MRRTVTFLLALLLSATVQSGCGTSTSPCDGTAQVPPRNEERVSIEQGLWGDVWFWEGDFIPTCPTGSVTPVGREMRIHEIASLSDVVHVGNGVFYSEVNTPLAATVWSDANGFFQSSLPPGQYSVFVVEDALLYANGLNGEGHIFPIEVEMGAATEAHFDITYLAVQ